MSSQPSRRDTPINKRSGITAVLLTVLIDLIGFSIVFPLFPAMLDYYLPREGARSVLGVVVSTFREFAVGHGADPQFLTHVLFGGVLGSLFSILQFVFSPIWGGLSDRYGRRPILIFTISGTTISYLIWVFSGSFWLLVISRIIGGAMSGNFAVATAAVADHSPPEKRGGAMALVGAAFGVGLIVGPALGGFSALIDPIRYNPELASYGINPFSVPAAAAALLSALNLVWVWRRFPDSTSKRNRDVSPGARSAPFRHRLMGIFVSVDKRIRRANLVYFLFMLSFSGMEFTLTFLAFERLAFEPHDNALMFVFVGVVLVLVQGVVVRRVAPRSGERALITFGTAFGIAAFSLLALAANLLEFFAGLALLAVGVGLTSPSLTSLVSLYSNPEKQGQNLGGFRSAGSLARAIGPIVASVLYWSFGSRFSYFVGAMILTVPLLLSFTLPKPKPFPSVTDSSPTNC